MPTRAGLMALPLDDEAARVGRRIRAIRKARGLTLVELAARADLSHPFLSQLERGLARPSMPSLERLARGLGLSQVELLSEAAGVAAEASEPVILRAGHGRSGAYGEGRARMLLEGGAFLPLHVSGTDTEFGTIWRHPEQEWLYVLDGEVEVELAGRRHLLAIGDSACCPPEVTHRWRSTGGAPYAMLVVKERLVGP